MRLLIIEDEKDIADPVAEVLEQEGFTVDCAYDGKKGLSLSKINSYDCILLDLNLPKMDGIKVAQQLRKLQINVPIIMVTARSQMYNKLEGFESGADDYVTKPFDLRELIARIKAQIKRNQNNHDHRLTFSSFELLPRKNKILRYKNKKVTKQYSLSTKETAVLEYLIRNKGNIISTEELLEHVWGNQVDDLTDTVKTHIKTLRKKFDPQKKAIKTVRGKGYLVE